MSALGGSRESVTEGKAESFTVGDAVSPLALAIVTAAPAMAQEVAPEHTAAVKRILDSLNFKTAVGALQQDHDRWDQGQCPGTAAGQDRASRQDAEQQAIADPAGAGKPGEAEHAEQREQGREMLGHHAPGSLLHQRGGQE